jgi:chromosome segregation ATPase
MKQPSLTISQVALEQWRLQDIQQAIEVIDHKLDAEISAKQRTIEIQELEVQRLNKLSDEKNNTILQMHEQLGELNRTVEGNRQLVNKLLNDIERLQQDIEWYKRTYETRSLLGTIKQKLLKW